MSLFLHLPRVRVKLLIKPGDCLCYAHTLHRTRSVYGAPEASRGTTAMSLHHTASSASRCVLVSDEVPIISLLLPIAYSVKRGCEGAGAAANCRFDFSCFLHQGSIGEGSFGLLLFRGRDGFSIQQQSTMMYHGRRRTNAENDRTAVSTFRKIFGNWPLVSIVWMPEKAVVEKTQPQHVTT